ncbi:hypothetical protein B0H10DRAFT_2056795, partial [Mycena sp. CBHHK59/15]
MARPRRHLDAIFDTLSSPFAPPPTENGSTTPAGSPPSRRLSSAPETLTNHSRDASSSPYASARTNRH